MLYIKIAIFSCIFFSQILLASTDDLRLKIEASMESQLRWDNLQGEDEWLEGVKPYKDKGVYKITLKPQARVCVLLNSDSWFRVIAENNVNWEKDILLEQSTDGFLFIDKDVDATIAEKNALLEPISETSSVCLSNKTTTNQQLALYVSRELSAAFKLHYKEPVLLDLEKINLQITPNIGWQSHYVLPKNVYTDVVVQGPQRLKLNLRMPMNESYSPKVRSYLNIYIDDVNKGLHDLYFKEDVSHAVRISTKRQPMSAVETYYINIPEGEHRLKLQVASTVYIQLLALGDQLLSQDNFPEKISWLSDRSEWLESSVQKTQYKYSKLAQDSAIPESALAAIHGLSNETIYSSLNKKQLIKDQQYIKDHYTKFKSLNPVFNDKIEQRWLKYFTSSLRYSQHKPVYYLSESFFSDRLNHVSQQVFYKLNKKGLNFLIDELAYDSDVKLLVYSDESISSHELQLQLDNEAVKHVRFSTLNVAEDYKHKPISEYVFDKEICCLDNSVSRPSLYNVASLNFPAHALNKKLSIVSNDPAENLWVSVSQRKTLDYQLSESQYLYQLQKVDDALDSFIAKINEYRETSGKINSKKSAIYNHWQPYFKKLYARYISNIENIRIIKSIKDADDSVDLYSIREKAIKASALSQWALAIENWSSMLPLATGDAQQEVLQGLLKTFKKSGQYVLARQLQRAIIFSDLSADFIRRQLYSLLSEYKEKNKGDARVSLASAFFMHNPNIDSQSLLSSVLFEEGQWQQALQLQLILPLEKQNRDIVLFSALKIAWYDVFENSLLAADLSESEKHKWLGLKALFINNNELARSHFKLSGDLGNQFLSLLDKSESVMDLLDSFKDTDLDVLTKQWHGFEDDLMQLGSDWKNADELIKQHSGKVDLFNRLSQVSLSHSLALPEQEFFFEVLGPVNLKLQVRPLHSMPNANQVINDVFYIEEQGSRQSVLINNNTPAEYWQMQSPDNEYSLPGNVINTLIFVPVGIHRFKLISKKPLLVRLHKEEGIIPFNNVDSLDTEYFSHTLTKSLAHISSRAKIVESADYQRLMDILVQLETGDKSPLGLIAESENIYEKSERDSKLTSLMYRIRSHSQWNSLNSIEKSSGFWLQKYQETQAETEQGRIYQAVVLNAQGAHEILQNNNDIILSLYNPKKTQIKLGFKSLSPFFIRPEALKISYQLDGDAPVELMVSKNLDVIALDVPEGRHSIKISLLEAPLHHRLWLSLFEQNKANNRLDKSRRYQIASKNKNLIYAVQGPVWLRIDKRVGDIVTINYQYISEAQKKVILPADASVTDTYYRVFYRDIKPALKKNKPSLKSKVLMDKPLSVDIPPLVKKQQHKPEKLIDAWTLGKQEDGTLTYRVSQIVQDIVAGELISTGDEFIQADIAYRQYNQLSDQWFYLSALTRYRQQANATLGIKSRLRGRFDFIPIDWTVDGQLFTQQLYSAQEWSSQIQLALSQSRSLNQYFYHLPKIQILRRVLSRNSSVSAVNVDQDVLSNYKLDHPSAIRLADTIVYRPYQDMEFYLGAERISNSRWLDTDQLRGRIGWRLLKGNVRWDINLRKTQFKADDDRYFDAERNILQTRLLLEKWIKPRYRLELSASLQRDMDTDEKTLAVQLSLHQSEGRGYLDYSPAELLFRDIRQAKLLPELNNELN